MSKICEIEKIAKSKKFAKSGQPALSVAGTVFTESNVKSNLK